VCENRLPLAIHNRVMARAIVARTTHELRQQGLAFVTVSAIAVTARKARA
jgi:hypothetical protein